MVLTQKQATGEIGESLAVKHLVKHSFKILDRNYRKKWGEIDIVAEKNSVLHFIEVKSISYGLKSGVSHETYQPEENVNFWKRKRLSRAINTYLSEKQVADATEWQVDIIAVFLDFKSRRAKIRVTENVLL